jgi:hypothetical protein
VHAVGRLPCPPQLPVTHCPAQDAPTQLMLTFGEGSKASIWIDSSKAEYVVCAGEGTGERGGAGAGGHDPGLSCPSLDPAPTGVSSEELSAPLGPPPELAAPVLPRLAVLPGMVAARCNQAACKQDGIQLNAISTLAMKMELQVWSWACQHCSDADHCLLATARC